MFNFKRFSVRNNLAAMKVGTDTVLIGAAATIKETDRRILDAGTGTGTIALILAQRFEDMAQKDTKILGVDIDELSVEEATQNFAASPWSEQLSTKHISVQKVEGQWDLIVSNPPFFEASLKNPDLRKSMARHANSSDTESSDEAPMSYRILIQFAADHLTHCGRLSMILPYEQQDAALRYGKSFGLYPLRVLKIKTVEGKIPKRSIIEFGSERVKTVNQELTMTEKGLWTKEYTDLVGDLYLNKA